MERWLPKLFLLFLSSLVSLVISSNLPSHGCYWTESCQNKWIGGCGVGHVIINQSDNCNGLCAEPEYPPCLPFYSHFHCCKPEIPKVTDTCTKCKNKVDYGDKYICCTDCSDPIVVDDSTKLGYCRTGAELALQLKPKEHFQWVVGRWMRCSSPCDGGVRYRDVECFGQIDDVSIPHYPVDDSKCLAKMPSRQEACNLRSCRDFNSKGSGAHIKHSGMSAWLVTLLVLFGLVAIGGLGFAGYTLYQRRTSPQHGMVYIMLEGYS